MFTTLDRLKRPDPVIFAIVALLCASTLVVYLQHRALVALDRQTAVILQKVAEQTATAVNLEIRRTFDGPVFDVLPAVNHPLLAAGRLDLLAPHYAKGLNAYPHVERFFVWSELTEAVAPGEVLFYGGRGSTPVSRAEGERDPLHLFYRDSPMGRRVLETARRYAKSQRIYAAVSERIGQTPYDFFVRLLYTDAARTRFFAVLGFLVNLDTVRTRLFPALYERQFAALLDPRDGSPPFQMQVVDDTGRIVFGGRMALPAVAARSRFALQFYPEEDIGPRMASGIPSRQWTLVISPRAQSASSTIASTRTQSYWLSGLSVLLMIVALAFAVQSRKRAEQLARVQADFVAHVSHQLKTPVSLLSAVGETLALDRVRSPEKLAQYVDIVRGETSRLSALVERILEFSRAGDSRRGYELEPVNLAILARETVEAFGRALSSNGYRIQVVDTGAAPVVVADPAAIEQALVNLLDNAIKYGGESREVTVQVGITRSDATIDVIDRGIGIDPGERARIFERFYRGAGAAMNRRGFGLGLAIAQELVAAHRGRIEVESTPGSGSTFRIRIPLGHAAAEHEPRRILPGFWARLRGPRMAGEARRRGTA
ncbi:MAG: HAMP domain-containing histidine kinase [Acidobacteria bacterium]|nr:HAMP domain-containing histidine kinase [Acidobacteriota bacterium]